MAKTMVSAGACTLFWQNYLTGAGEQHALPVLQPERATLRNVAPEQLTTSLNHRLTKSLKELSKQHSVTLFSLLETTFALLVCRLSNESDIVIGTPVSNRPAELHDVVGLFANSLPIRTQVRQDDDFSTLLLRNSSSIKDAIQHGTLPFEEIVRATSKRHSIEQHPLFQLFFTFQQKTEQFKLNGLEVSEQAISHNLLKFELELHAFESSTATKVSTTKEIELVWRFDSNLFSTEFIDQLTKSYQLLLQGIVDGKHDNVWQLPIARAESVMLKGELKPHPPHEQYKAIHTLISEQAQQTPDHPAIYFNGSVLSYSELNTQVNKLANYLIDRGVVSQDIVAVFLPRSTEMIVSILAILKSGAAFLPIDISSPSNRLKHILDDACAKHILIQRTTVNSLSLDFFGNKELIHLDCPKVVHDINKCADITPEIESFTQHNLAYVIYTSGTTGTPKGVAIEHLSLSNLVVAQHPMFKNRLSSRVLQFAAISFDAAVSEWATTLTQGATLYVIEPNLTKDPKALGTFILEHGITCTTLPPSLAPLLSDDALNQLSVLTLAGEKPNSTFLQYASKFSNLSIYNAYGPTEATVCTTFKELTKGEYSNNPSIGKPVANTSLLVLNSHLQPQPQGISGELFISGVGLSRGYLGQPQLTEEKFIELPWNAYGCNRWYRTGDLVRVNGEQELEFINRVDSQINLRGYRIEPSEVVEQLLRLPEIEDSVVLLSSSLETQEEKVLVAYVVCHCSEEEQNSLLQVWLDALSVHLPEYMIPRHFVFLSQLPLNVNGKVDQEALLENRNFTLIRNEYVVPDNQIEDEICTVWADVLKVSQVGASDNFFSMGGSSLDAMKAAGLLEKRIKKEVSIRDILETRSVRSLAQRISSSALSILNKIEPREDQQQEAPLSYAQQRLWLLDQMDEVGDRYNIATALKLSGKLDVDGVHYALTQIVERHQVLRTYIVAEGDQVKQRSHDSERFSVSQSDLSALPLDEQELRLQVLMAEESARSFDLSADLMIRARLYRLSAQEYVLQVTMHHIASDGWSMKILVDEFRHFYAQSERTDKAAALSLQYADYAKWQRDWLQGDVLLRHQNYWQQQLSDLPTEHGLALDFPRPKKQSSNGGCYRDQIDVTTGDALQALCRRHDATLFMGLHTVFSVLLSRYSQELDIVVGSPVANREQSEVAELIGFFVNTLVLRSDLSGEPDFVSLLERNRRVLLDAYEHQQMPFEQLVELLQPERSLSHSPLFQVMLILQNNDSAELSLPEVEVTTLEPLLNVAKYDLTLVVEESEQGLRLNWEYSKDVFTEATITRMAGHYKQLLTSLLAYPSENVFDVEMLTPSEQAARYDALLPVELSGFSDVYSLFSEQVQSNPDAVALWHRGDSLSYSELDKQAKSLAVYLREEHEVSVGERVGVFIPRSFDTVVVILGLFKAGLVYVPLDESAPDSRLNYQLEDAGVKTVLTDSSLLARLPLEVRGICLDEETVQRAVMAPQGVLEEKDWPLLTAESLAYIIYTSGSTGQPKGVMVEHGQLSNVLSSVEDVLSMSATDRLTNLASSGFDISLLEQLLPLLSGGSVQLQSSAEVRDVGQLVREMQQVSVLHAVPSLMRAWLNEVERQRVDYPQLRCLLVGGEAVPKTLVQDVRAYFPDVRLVEFYGPTENTIISTYHDKTQMQSSMHCIGRTFRHVQSCVVDGNGRLATPGSVGELYLGGGSVSRGYLHRPELTEERFINCDFLGQGESRYYRTGDLVRLLPDGTLEYVGRNDQQVKIRGYRVELGEIEEKLLECTGVKEAVVRAQDVSGQGNTLVAYVTLLEEEGSSRGAEDRLRQSLSSVLPTYMLPAHYVMMAQLPRNENGKLRLSELPAPELKGEEGEYVAPESELEQCLSKVWSNVLGVEKVGLNDNFFTLGGHSLLVVEAISALKELGIEVSVAEFFSAETLSGLAQKIDTSSKGLIKPKHKILSDKSVSVDEKQIAPVNLNEEEVKSIADKIGCETEQIETILPLSSIQEGILYHHLLNPQEDMYVIPALFKLDRNVRLPQFVNVLNQVIQRHDALRTVFIWQGLDSPKQIVLREAKIKPVSISLTGHGSPISQLKAKCNKQSCLKELSQAPLLELFTCETEEGDFVLINMHHLISDHIGLEILRSEINALLANAKLTLVQPTQFSDFITHSHNHSQKRLAEYFFKENFVDFSIASMPYDMTQVNWDDLESKVTRVKLTESLSQSIRKASALLMMSPATLFHSAFALVISKLCQSDDVVFGTVQSGRLSGLKGVENIMGVLINTLPIRINLRDQDVLGLLTETNDFLRELVAFEQTSLAEIQKLSGIESGQPLFTCLMNYRHSSTQDSALSGTTNYLEFIHSVDRTNYPVNVNVDDLGELFSVEVQIDSEYNVELFVSYLTESLIFISDALHRDICRPVANLGLLSSQELLLQHSWAEGEKVKFSSDNLVLQFLDQVRRNGEKIAVQSGDLQLTYQQLYSLAIQLSARLKTEGRCGKGDRVGLCYVPSIEGLTSIWAIILSGASFVPLDPDSPTTRLNYIVEDADLKCIITGTDLLSLFSDYQYKVVTFDYTNLPLQQVEPSVEQFDNDNNEEFFYQPAYILFTSGSTGKPKGVVVPWRGLQNYTEFAAQNYYSNCEKAVVSGSLAFDATITSIFAPLCSGSTCQLLPQQGLFEALCSEISEATPKVFKLTPAHLSVVNDLYSRQFGFPSVVSQHVFVVGGDKLNSATVRELKNICPMARVINEYGPTETTVGCCIHEIKELTEQVSEIAIGKPIRNTQLYVLNQDQELIPLGATGELYIGGHGLAHGYLNRAVLTNEKFITPPASVTERFDTENNLLYRTGDLVKWLPNGELQFLGRKDTQLNRNGYRIEAGEIESQLAKVPGVINSFVLQSESTNAGTRIVAYFVAHSEHIDSVLLTQHLEQVLPGFMVPDLLIKVEHLPLTTNGKVDTKRLPTPEVIANNKVVIQPTSEIEKTLHEIWCDVLSTQKISCDDNFFDLGGHSLLATRVVAKVNHYFNLSLSLKEVISQQTITKLGKYIEQEKTLHSSLLTNVELDSEDEEVWEL
ncbi:MAG: amino acid adenylation domain-containing protein [Pseudoalteromonas sp.]|nr:amino acid adenylation domain-containing protein [Pseudoalteromonas sp.]